MAFRILEKKESKIGLPDAFFSLKIQKAIKAGTWNDEVSDLFTRVAQHLDNAQSGLFSTTFFSTTFLGTENLKEFFKAREVMESLGIDRKQFGKHLNALESEVKGTIAAKQVSLKYLGLTFKYYDKLWNIAIANGSKFSAERPDLPPTRI